MRWLIAITLTLASQAVAAPPEFVREIRDSDKRQHFRDIGGVALGADSTLIVTNKKLGGVVVVGDKEPVPRVVAGKGRVLKSAALKGITPAGKNRFAVAGSGDNRIALISADGKVGKIFGGDAGAARLNRPAAVAYSNNERFYVADQGHDRIAVFGRDGVFLYAFGNTGSDKQKLDNPVTVGVDTKEQVYVLDRVDDGRVSVFSHDGRLLGQISARQYKGSSERKVVFSAMAVDTGGHLFVGDSGNGKLIELNWRNGEPVQVFGSRGKGRGQFQRISALAVADDGRLAVADDRNHKIEVYRIAQTRTALKEPERLANITVGGFTKKACTRAYAMSDNDILCVNGENKRVTRISGDGKKKNAYAGPFRKPVAAAFDGGTVAILDSRSLKVFSDSGKHRFTVGKSGSRDGQFRNPADVALRDGRIYVADTDNHRVQIFTQDGVFLGKIANTKDQSQLLHRPVALTVDSKNNLFVADADLNKIRVFSKDGHFKFDLDAKGSSAGRFVTLYDIAVDQDDNLYVLCGIPGNTKTVLVYSGPKLIFRFGSYSNNEGGLIQPTSISPVSSQKTTINVYDRKRGGLVRYRFLQVPARVGGLVVEGGVEKTTVRWQKVPGSYVAGYNIYGATEDDPGFRKITSSNTGKTDINHKAGIRYTRFRVSAISGFGVEGLPAPAKRDLFQVGFTAFSNNKFDEAVKVFAEASDANPDHGAAMEYLGRSLLALGKYRDAARQFRELAGKPGFKKKATALQADALFQAGDYIRARALLDRVISSGDQDVDALVLCGQLSLKLGDAIGAVNCLEKALKNDTNRVETHFLLGRAYIKVGAVENGLAEFNRAVKLDPRNAEVWVEGGKAFFALKRYKTAIARFDKALALDKLNAAARLGLARSYMALKKYDKARTIALSMAGDPRQEGAGHFLLGKIAVARGRRNEALLSLNKAGYVDPQNADVWLELAGIYQKMGDRDKTVDALNKAAKADPGAFAIQYRLGKLNRKRGNNASAARYLERAVELDSNHFQARQSLAETYAAMERYQDATRHATEALRIRPGKTDSLVLLADIAHHQGKSGEAIDYLKKAIRRNKTSARLHTLLGRIYLENNIYDFAQKELERAVILAPKKAEPRVILGQLFLEKRNFDAAIKVLDRAVKLNPSADNKLLRNTAYAEKRKSLEFKNNAPRIVLERLRMQQVFSSAYKQYANKSVGTVRVRNIGGMDYQNLSVAFHIKDYMDFPTTQDIPLLKANSTREVPLLASFNNKVLGIDEDTGVQVQVKLSFFHDGKRDSIELTQPMTLYGKNAIVWERANMVGSFVTPKDDQLRNFVRQGINENRPEPGPLNGNLVTAMTLFNIVFAHGLRYQVDPNSPYSKLSADQVDYVQFPRETLRLKSGDCDDLSVLYAAGLENLGIETAFVDVPGHLFMMFNTGLPVAKREAISLQRELVVERGGMIWIPVEATMISTSFSEAWAEGASKYRTWQRKKKLEVIATRDAWAEFQPVTLAPADHSIKVPIKADVTPIVKQERKRLIAKSLDRLVMPYRTMAASGTGGNDALLQVAIIYAKYSLYEEAIRELDAILAKNSKNSAAYNNRGNIYLMREKYAQALDAYRYAERLDPNDGGIKLNLAMVYYQLGRISDASEKFREATILNKSIAEQYRTFGRLLKN